MTEKQKRFVDYFIETGNQTEAAKKAGYSEKTARVMGQENMLKPAIKAAIDEGLEKLQDERTAGKTEVMQFLTTVMRGELQEEVVTSEGTGEGRSKTKIVKKQVSARDRLDAAKQLARRYGLDKLVVEQKLDDRIQFIEPPDEDVSHADD
ncbi:MAG: terminase small subunit [Selenomonadaceae bacterium]|nr:terminase small subunit [Selenomonadaceae bacterium]